MKLIYDGKGNVYEVWRSEQYPISQTIIKLHSKFEFSENLFNDYVQMYMLTHEWKCTLCFFGNYSKFKYFE